MKFTKKPVTIDAWGVITLLGIARYDHMLPDSVHQAWERGDIIFNGDHIVIRTLEGDMVAKPGDMLIRGIQGEFYPCKPDIFAETYEPAEDE